MKKTKKRPLTNSLALTILYTEDERSALKTSTRTLKKSLTSESKVAILKEVGLETPHNTKADTMNNENTKKFKIKSSIDWFFRGNAKSKISKEEIFEKTFNHFLTFELCDMETTKILDFISQFEEEMVEDIEEDIVEEVKDTKKKFVMTEEMVEDMGDICAFWDRELYKDERVQKVEEVVEKITYEEVLEKVVETFGADLDIYVSQDTKSGYVLLGPEDITEEIFVKVTEKDVEVTEALKVYKKIDVEEEYFSRHFLENLIKVDRNLANEYVETILHFKGE